MKEYIKAIRLPAALFTGMTTFVGFKLAHNVGACVVPIITTLLIFFATMAQKDLRDRWNDHKKAKDFAFDHPAAFRRFTAGLWLLASTSAIVLALQNPRYIAITLPMIAIGFIYSEVQLVPYLANTLVGLATSLSVFYSIFNCENPESTWFFGGIIFVAMFAREILKDYDDKEIDPGHKWTLIDKFGEEGARTISAFIIIAIDRITEIATLPLLIYEKVNLFRTSD